MATRVSVAPDDAPVRVFLSGVASVTHLIYVASYLRHLLADSNAPITVVNVGLRRFMGRANVDARDVAALLPNDPRLSVITPQGPDRWRTRPGERRVYVGIGAPGIKPYLRLRLRAAAGRSLHVVVVDEGIGSYGNWRTRQDSWRREGGRGPWPTVRALGVTWARRLLTDERWALYRCDRAGWWVDDRVAAEFRRGLSDGAPEGGTGGGTAVFLSQPWVELGVLDEQAYLGHLREIAAGCRAAGLSFLLRTHPAEDQDRYAGLPLSRQSLSGQPLSRQHGPAELDPEVAGAAAVLGTSSTAMLNVAALYGTPAVRVAVPGLAHLDDELNAGQRSLLDAFLPAAVAVDELSERLHRVRGSSPPAR